MTDQQIVDEAYEATVKQMTAQLFSVLLVSQDANERTGAEQRFQSGVRKASEVRDRAKQLLK